MQRTLRTALRHVHPQPTLPPKSRFHAGYQGIVQHRIERSKQHPARIQSREKWTRKKAKDLKEKHARKEEEFKKKMLNEELRNRRVLDRFLDQSEWAGRLYPERPRDSSGNLLPLTDEQQAIMKLVIEDEQNVFFTGPAGSGKSMLLRELIAALEEKYPTKPNRVQVCVDTGLVREQAWGKNLEEARVVILDRISMMRTGDFVQLERDARRIRKNDRPFGGLQIVATGDFAQQLRDPNPKGEQPAPESMYGAFCFEAPTWPLIKHQVSLSHVFCHKDPDFVRMLNETREGHVSNPTIATLERLDRPLIKWHGLEPTALSSSPEEVNEVNRTRIDRLHGKGYTFRALSYYVQGFTQARNRLSRQCIAPNWLQLKLQAQVMLTKNLSDPRLTIGTIGKVVSFHPTGQGDIPRPKVRFVLLDGSTVDHICAEETWKADCYVPGQGRKILASKTQIPLVHAWALTVAAAQGLTLPRVKVDLAQTFKPGELYAALSRAPGAQHLQLANYTKPKGSPSEQIQAFHQSLRSPLPPGPPPLTQQPLLRVVTASSSSSSSPAPDTP